MESDAGPGSATEVTLRDGARLVVRAIAPADRDQLLAGFEQLSPESRYRRFFSTARRLAPRELTYLTEVDHHGHEALVAVAADSGNGVAVARYVRAPQDPSSAELGIAVADAWQRRGVGALLLERLAERARSEGVRRLTAVVLAENVAMRRLLERLGPTRAVRSGDGTIDLVTDLRAPP